MDTVTLLVVFAIAAILTAVVAYAPAPPPGRSNFLPRLVGVCSQVGGLAFFLLALWLLIQALIHHKG